MRVTMATVDNDGEEGDEEDNEGSEIDNGSVFCCSRELVLLHG
jgi:hypothetical protein